MEAAIKSRLGDSRKNKRNSCGIQRTYRSSRNTFKSKQTFIFTNIYSSFTIYLIIVSQVL